jgi:hypothetical protein
MGQGFQISKANKRLAEVNKKRKTTGIAERKAEVKQHFNTPQN